MAPGLAAGEQGRGGGLHGHNPHVGVLLLQVAAHACNGAAGTYAGHEDVHLAVGIVPDLWAGGAVVGPGIGGGIKLTGQEAARDRGGDLLGLFHGARHTALGRGQHQLRTVGGQQLPALQAHGLGHGEDDLVATGQAHGRETYAGVAGGGLHDGAAGQELALFFGVFNHFQGYTILYGAGGVEGFQLDQHGGGQAELLRVAHRLQQGGVADQLGCRAIDVHNDLPFCVGREMPMHSIQKAEDASCTLCRSINK